MKNSLRGLAAAFTVAVAVITARAETPATAPATAPATDDAHWGTVAKYVDDQTLLVAHLDLEKIDLPATEKFANELLDAATQNDKTPRPNLQPLSALAQGYRARLTKMGARHAYLLISHPDAWPGMEPLAVLLPVESGGDAKAIMDSLKALLGDAATVSQLANNLVYVGQAAPLKRLEKITPVKRSDIETAMISSSGGALQVVIAPTRDERRAVAELLPRLPAEFAQNPMDASTDFLTQGLKAITLRVDLPPKAMVSLSIASENDSGAKVTGLLTKALEALKSNPDFVADAPKELRDFVGTLTPSTMSVSYGAFTESFTTISLDEKALKAFAGALAPVVEKEAREAQQVASQVRLSQIVRACYTYAADHKDQWPATLDALVDAKLVTADLLVNPNDKMQRRYEYHPWTTEEMKKGGASAFQWPVLWEVVDDEPSPLNVAYVDGHVEYCPHQKTFKEILQKAQTEAGRTQQKGAK